jgi:hypothetical protein
VWNPKPSDGFPHGRFSKYKPELVHPYRTEDGQIYGCTIRVNISGQKIVPMLRMIEKNGRKIWSHFPFPKPRPPYGIETVKNLLGDPIVIVEGEKCADVAKKHLNAVVLTWAGGVKALKFTDWSCVSGKNVLCWPDNDQVGIEAMIGRAATEDKPFEPGVMQYCRKAGALQVKSLTLDPDKPKGWDIADAIQRDRMSRLDIFTWIRSNQLAAGEKIKTWK